MQCGATCELWEIELPYNLFLLGIFILMNELNIYYTLNSSLIYSVIHVITLCVYIVTLYDSLQGQITSNVSSADTYLDITILLTKASSMFPV